MKLFSKRINKMLLAMLLVSATSSAVFAADNIISGIVLKDVNGNYGANLIDVTGATVSTKDYNNTATITNTATKSTLNWKSLNVAKGQTLNYVMNDGQTSINIVSTGISTGISQFAGTVSTLNENELKGRLIIVNPNGMVFESGSHVNANALVLTTHAYTQSVNDVTLNGTGKPITLNGTMEIANDLYVVANKIDTNGANITAGNINLVTADGVTFNAINTTTPVMTPKISASSTSQGDININNSTFLVKDNTTGKLYIVSGAKTLIQDSNATNHDLKIVSKGKVDVEGSNGKIAEFKSIDATSNEGQGLINYVKTNTGDISLITSDTSSIDFASSKGSITLKSEKNDSAIGSKGAVSAGGDININAYNGASLSNAKASKDINLTSETAGIVVGGRGKVVGQSLTTKAYGIVNIDNAYITNDIKAESTNKAVTIGYNNGPVTLINGSVTANAKAGSYIYNTTARNGYINSTSAKVFLYNDITKAIDLTANSGSIFLKNIVINSGAETSKISATDKVSLKNVSGSSNLTSTTGKALSIVNSSFGSLETSSNGDTTILGSNVAGNLNITKANDVIIANNKYSPQTSTTIRGLSNRSIIVPNQTSSNAYLNNIASNYGPAYGEGTRISFIGGNLNISNANSVNIINSAVMNGVTENNVQNNTNIITSYIEGTNSLSSTNGETNMYETYAVKNSSINDVNQLKYGSSVNTAFNQSFTPRGFAADDDLIRQKKDATLSTVARKSKDAFGFTKEFKAY